VISYDEKLLTFMQSHNIASIVKSIKLQWVGHVAGKRDKMNT
jgi:hypothetical protein